MSKNKKNYQPKKRVSAADKVTNAIMAVVIVAVLGLAVWAVAPKFQAKIEETKAAEEASKPDTIQKRADEKGVSVEDFIAEYGITGEDINGETLISQVAAQMTVENYAKLEGTTVEEFISSNGLPADKVTGDMTVEAANALIPIKTVIASSGMDFDTFKSTYGLGDDITEDTPWVDVEETVYAAMQAQQEAAAAAEEAVSEENADTEEEPAQENATEANE